MKVSVRLMEQLDLEAVLSIERQSFSTPWSREAFEGELANQLAVYVVVEVNDVVIAYGGMWIILDEAHITNVAVLPEYRGVGVGKALMQALINRARAKGAVSMTLEVRKSNIVAQSLYKSFGFEISGVRPGYYVDLNEDALIMWLYDL